MFIHTVLFYLQKGLFYFCQLKNYITYPERRRDWPDEASAAGLLTLCQFHRYTGKISRDHSSQLSLPGGFLVW
ncbi:hypothetical protein N288_13425 [Bacillus infantis NRRL B-14911]|uniref:Uncharacterized protein n=1 Tax=Bacillus infantis NRRL B-14911 TaxID=1367477 RepID=U5LD97_9BACI|nr:hypothetical protein N288_13425 [Bacillus infantis NRRL B-14911]